MSPISAAATADTVYNLVGKTIDPQSFARRTESRDLAELQNVCEDFESLFVKMMLDAMRSSLDENTLIPKNTGAKIFEDQLYSEYAQKISHTSNLGIAEIMYNQLQSALPGSSLNLST